MYCLLFLVICNVQYSKAADKMIIQLSYILRKRETKLLHFSKSNFGDFLPIFLYMTFSARTEEAKEK